MLKGIPKIISPELLKILSEMGHGDRICIGDGNFPAESVGKNSIVIRADGLGCAEMLEAILKLFPLDRHVEKSVFLMELTPGDVGKVKTPIWDRFAEIVSDADDRGADTIGYLERFEFYKEAAKCYCVVATGEGALYGNVMIQKGVI